MKGKKHGAATGTTTIGLSPTAVTRAATLDGFVNALEGAEEVRLGDLQPLTTLIVLTRNSRYRVILTNNGVLIQGGQFFPDTTPAFLDGGSFGGSFLKVGSIVTGMSMEIRAGGRRIITSPVRSIAEEHAPAV